MQKTRYALVAYVRGTTGEFVENLRRELHPALPYLAAHLTILPPRPCRALKTPRYRMLERICSQETPFQVNLGAMESFVPVTPTVYITVDGAARRMCELHRKLNTGALEYKEEWPYVPHLTIVKLSGEQPAREALLTARDRWNHFNGSRLISVEKLTFVREDEQHCWIDLAPVLLGRSLVSR